MQFSLVGVNHQTAPVAIREKMAVSNGKLSEALALLRAYIPQAVILSTCNRTEIYSDSADLEKAVLAFFKARSGIAETDLRPYCYIARDRGVVEHLFRVTSGLESMIVGEFEVLGQARQALEAAEEAGTVSLPLREVFHSAIRTGRRIRQETGISKNALSVSSVAVDLAERVVGDLSRCRMLVIGAGEAGRLVAKVARGRGATQIVIASRTRKRAQALAEALDGVAIGLEGLSAELGHTSIVVTCAGAPHRILSLEQVAEAMKQRPEVPLVIIDIAVPRNVAPEVARLKNVFLYNLDDLTGVANTNRRQRKGAIKQAEEIVADEVDKFVTWWHDFEVRPVLSALMTKAEAIRAAQLNKTVKKLPPLSSDQQECLESMTKSIVTRLLKDPIQYLKTNGNGRDSKLVKELFRLDAEKPS